MEHDKCTRSDWLTSLLESHLNTTDSTWGGGVDADECSPFIAQYMYMYLAKVVSISTNIDLEIVVHC